MSQSSQVVKITAKASLKNKWVMPIIVTSIFLFTVLICYNIASVLSIIAGDIPANVLLVALVLLIVCPMFLGAIRYFWRNLFNMNDKPVSVFYYFSGKKVYLRAMWFVLAFSLRMLLFGLLLNIPRFIVELMSRSFLYELIGMAIPVWTANLTYVTVFLKVLATVILFFVMLKYYMAPVLFVADDNMDSGEAMHMSSIISKKTSIDFIYLCLSFVGWIILSVLIIPLIFTIPYIATSYLIHVRFSVAEYNKHIETTAQNIYPSYTVLK